ncbi:MAG: hypothetical protein B5M52_04115 [Helicobacteraceae bacterium 4484_230]|nr:MAG: hypothetical protein B5M52_04115 [Helicobacteraceae bacterium 4484_230]
MILNNLTLLFVEDDIDTQIQIKMIFKDDVKAFYQAYDGEEGLELYKKYSPDIVLTDINMPRMSGLDMSGRIKSINQSQHILVLSAFDDKDILLEAINMGIDGFIVKPIDIESLYKKLDYIAQNLLDRAEAQNIRQKEIELKQKEEMLELYNLAHYDILTNIPNRFLFNEKLDQAIDKAKEMHNKTVLFFIDLDNFKIINDTYGHKVGDHVLICVVNSIKSVIRNNDTFARIGGDEFALIIENALDKACLEELAKKIIKASASPIYFKDCTINISCSVGISRYGYDSKSKDELIHYADYAMYNAKSLGKSHYSFYEDCGHER